ncbi:putative oxidoreductase [Sphingomonas zeicaulis]|uniref:DoxX family protein n=1 Tax=Sphingomonas zeicaulis TaxID=1632740 RepID=UPI003D22B6AB
MATHIPPLSPDAPATALPTSLAALAGRLLIVPIFLLSGLAKIHDPNSFIGYAGAVGLPLPTLSVVVAILVELLGSAALIAGYKTRAMAWVLAGFCVMTALIFHTKLSDPNEYLFFWKNLAIAGGLVQLALLGAGRFSLDARRIG